MIVGHGPIALAASAGVVWAFLLFSIFSLLSGVVGWYDGAG